MLKVGLTGGIGCGKSTVGRVFSMLGVPVYDSDFNAKRLMNENEELKTRIRTILGSCAYLESGLLDRSYVASKVFDDHTLLDELNKIVHPAVQQDFEDWARAQKSRYVILESAILFESGFNKFVDLVALVTAPEHVRIERTVVRDGCDEKSVRARMSMQWKDAQREELSDYVIVNDSIRMVIPQVIAINEKIINR